MPAPRSIGLGCMRLSTAPDRDDARAAEVLAAALDAGVDLLDTADVAERLGIAIAGCPHPAGPPICWCRKPLPGLGLALARAHDLDLARTICVGTTAADRGFAARLGVPYVARSG